MKKSLIALAALAATSAAFAQSSVTLFGVVDLSYERVNTNAGTVSGLAPSANSSSRLGFRGVEDLGGGMSASFWLEAALAPQSGISSSGTNLNNQANTIAAGGLTFNRRSTVSLSGGFGELRLGRDYTPTFWNYTIFDPFGTNGVGATLPGYTGLASPTFVRASNSVGYFLPGNLGGIYGQVMYAFGNRQSTETSTRNTTLYGASPVDTSGNGTYWGGRIGYSQGPLNVAASYGRTKYAPGTLAVSNVLGTSVTGLTLTAGQFTDWSIGASYAFGSIKVMGAYSRQKLADFGAVASASSAGSAVLCGTALGCVSGGIGNSLTYKGYELGVDWGIGAGNVLASYSRSSAEGEHAAKWALGYVHNLSKRTAVYGYYSHVTNSDFASMNAGSYSSGGLGPVTGAVALTGLSAGDKNLGSSSWGLNIGLRHAF